MNILIVATIYRCGEKIYPIINELCDKHNIQTLFYNQMSLETKWEGDDDPRIKFKSSLRCQCIDGPSRDYIIKTHQHKVLYKILLRAIDFRKIDLIIVDDNVYKRAWGTPHIYDIAKSNNIRVIGCPHGNREFDKYIAGSIGFGCDYSFVFGVKEQDMMAKSVRRDVMFPGGIPANDKLKDYPHNNKHILIIPNHTYQPKSKTGYDMFSYDEFLKCGAMELSDRFDCPIVIKFKSRMGDNEPTLQRLLSKHNNVIPIMDVPDDNKLICDSVCVIGSPSTLCFKSIQRGIPTAVIKGQGMLGNFFDYPGLVNCDRNDIIDTIMQQMSTGRLVEFIDYTLSGGIEYNSTSLYCNTIDRLLGD